jgi:hypothetical protein
VGQSGIERIRRRTDGRGIDKFVGDDPERKAMLDEEIVNVEASVICRMEQADYAGSLPMLRRIAGALNRTLELRAVPIRPRSRKTARRA